MRRQLSLAVILTAIVPQLCSAVPVVWTGYNFDFTRPPGISVTHPHYRDVITPSVAFARGASAGLFNIIAESSFSATSPTGTRWATELIAGNGGLEIAASNWQQLNFSDWNSAYGGSGNLLANIASQNAVVHVVAEDIYFDIRFITWENGRTGGMGGFSYQRSTPPMFSGDFDLDGDVDGRDFLAWQRNPSVGNLADWQSNYGTGSSVAASVSVPEPSTWVLLSLMAVSGKHARWRRITG